MSSELQPGEIRSSREFPTLASIKKHAGTSHGLTLLALSAADLVNKNLNLEMKCSGDSQLQNFSGQINDVINTSQVTKFYLRSVKVNGVFQDSFNGVKLQKTDEPPVGEDDYNNAHVLLDIQVGAGEYVWKFYRYSQAGHRSIRLFV